MKTFKELISEVLEPRSDGERNFKGLHNPINHKDLVPGVTDQEHVFTGSEQKKDPSTASYHGTDDVEAYDKGLKIDPNRGQFGGKGTAAQAQGGLEEKKLTSAEMKKREEVAKAIERENPDMPMAKKMAVATATAKKVAEEALDEVSSKTLMSYSIKSASEVGKGSDKENKRIAGQKMADEKMRKKEGKSSMAKVAAEEVELDEMNRDAHFAKQSPKMQDAINRHLRQGLDYYSAAKKASTYIKDRDQELAAYDAKKKSMKKEEAGQIDELSKKTLGSYIKQATAKVHKSSFMAAKDKPENAAKHGMDAYKRIEGIRKATDKLTKEDHEIDEAMSLSQSSAAKKIIGDVAKKTPTGKVPFTSIVYTKAGKEVTRGYHDSEGNKVVTKVTKEELELDEARRGRPRKDGTKPESDEEGGREHIIMQLRKAVSLRGEKHVEFNDSKKEKIPVDHAKKALQMHDSMKRSTEKSDFAARLAKSHQSFKDAIGGKPAEKAKPKITLAGPVKEAAMDVKHSFNVDPAGGADATTMRSDRGNFKTYTTVGKDGRVKLVKHREHGKEVSIGESTDLDRDNVEKMIKHDCAKHVVHKEWGEGETVEGQHTIVESSEGEGYVTHYDVLFSHGIERDVPVEDLEIKTMVEHWHKNYKPKSKMKEETHPRNEKEKKLAAMAEPKDKITHKDVLIGRGVFKKKSMRESVSVNMAADSIKKLEKDPLASKEKIKLPPTQGNEPVGGEGEIAGGLGKSAVTEQALINLYDTLSEENKAVFESLIETEEGFERLVQFAENQGLI